MEIESTNPDVNRGASQLNDEAAAENSENANSEEQKPNLAPNKDSDYKVLNKDGSLADLPDQNVAGSGALDGTVGLGT